MDKKYHEQATNHPQEAGQVSHGAGRNCLVAGSLTAGLAGVASAAGNPPWEPVANPPEAGGLLFFNAAGQQITGGIVGTSPLAAYIEGTTVLNASDDKATSKCLHAGQRRAGRDVER